ncbi:MAG: dihydroorotate dehydrogenase electron transfer subunit [Candidatus Omnitrophica bacterium]|nr:dihydroorotate dehydrogenase electron transfer subunit [Candidatus Omnitrophota bacterium]
MKKIQNTYTVISNAPINTVYHRLVLDAAQLAKAVKPGQFVQVKVSDGLEPLFRRPFSIFRARDGQVEILYEPVGIGTRILTAKRKGDRLDVLGPLGRPFTMPGRRVRHIVFIGGGVGVAPFMLFSDVLKEHKAEKLLLYGGRTAAHTFSLREFNRNGVKSMIATDDGSHGVKGRVSELFGQVPLGPDTMIYACGPKPMMAAVQQFAKQNGLTGEASMEEVMACGLGACLGCSIPTVNGYRTVCHDGPVFSLEELVFRA